MSRSLGRVLLAASALLLPLTAAAVEAPMPKGTDYWFASAGLPCFLRAESRDLSTDDKDAALAEVGGWVEAHDGKPAPAAATAPVWVLPAGELKGFDAFLATQGRIVRRATAVPNLIDRMRPGRMGRDGYFLKMLDSRKVETQRRALGRELDEMGERAGRLPATSALVSAYIAALDQISDAFGKYVASVSVSVMASDKVSGEPVLVSLGNPVGRQYLISGSCEEWGPLRVPQAFGGGNESYFHWRTLNPLTLDSDRSLSAKLYVSDLDEAARKVDAALAAMGARPAAIEASKGGNYAGSAAAGRRAMRGYWVPRNRLDQAKAAVSGQGRLTDWQLHSVSLDPVYENAARWAASLQGELQSEEDRLTPFPYIQSLVLANLDQLRVYTERAVRSEDHELLAVEFFDVAAVGGVVPPSMGAGGLPPGAQP